MKEKKNKEKKVLINFKVNEETRTLFNFICHFVLTKTDMSKECEKMVESFIEKYPYAKDKIQRKIV